jgi:predicted permease
MMTMKQFRRSLRLILRREQAESEFAEELSYHAEMRARELVAAGVNPIDARRRAETEMGGTTRLRQDLREIHGTAFANAMEVVATDLRLALRRLTQAPGFTATIIMSVGIAIGANAAIYSAVRGLLVGPMPVADVDRVVWLASQKPHETEGAGLLDWEASAASRQRDVFSSVAVIGDRSLVRQIGNRRTRWHGLWVTPQLSEVLRIRPVIGRAITRSDIAAGAPVMMISHERWVSDLGSDSTVVGSILSFIDNKSFLVVGVLPPRLEFPFGKSPRAGDGAGYLAGVQDFWFLGQRGPELPGGTTIARLADGVTMERVMSAAQSISAQRPSDADSNRVIEATPVRQQALGIAAPGLRLAQAFAALILLLASANLANLLLLRLRGRATEFAVIAALGGSRRAVTRMIVIEMMVLVIAGSTLGILLAALAPQAFSLLSNGAIPMLDRIRMDWGVAAYSALGTLVVALISAIMPAVLMGRQPLASAITIGGRSQTDDGRMRRFRSGLVITQVALAFVLSIGAALIGTGFARLAGVDAGYIPRGVVAAEIEVFDHPDVAGYYRELDRQLRQIQGVEAVGLIHSTPLTGKWSFASTFEIPGRAYPPRQVPRVGGSFVAFDYFGAMRIPIVAGRSFTDPEYTGGKAAVIMINESAAKKFFPGESPLERTVILNDTPRRIVGVVKDSRDVRLDVAAEPLWYEPIFGAGNQIMVRGSRPMSELIPEVRRVLQASDPGLVIERIGPFEDIVAGTLADRRLAMRLVTLLAALALVLCGVGLYGLLGFAVRQRRREIGVRSALGASRGSLVGSVIREGISLASIGLAIGVAVSLGGARLIEGLLYEVKPTDPATFVKMSLLFVLIAAAASLFPGLAAMRIDPAIALRDE